MKKQHFFVKLIREVINLIVKFFKPYGLSDEMVSVPKNIKKLGFKLGFIDLGITVITIIFSFLLKLSNASIEKRFILLGIILFMLYRGQAVLREIYGMFADSENQKFNLIFDDEIVFRGSQIIGKTSDKVLKYDEKNKLYKIMDNESALNTIKRYLSNLWTQKIWHIFDLFEIISVIAMLVVSVVTNTAISQKLFIPLLILFVVASFLSSAYISMSREEFFEKNKELDNEQAVIVNDLLRVPVIVKGDLEMRIKKFKKTLTESRLNIKKFHKKLKNSRFILTVIEAISQYGIIVIYLLGIEWNSIDLATITDITATLAIVETALVQISRMATTLNRHSEKTTVLEREEPDMLLILDVYHRENDKTSKVIGDIKINPFSIQYFEESENDKPFTLQSEMTIHINLGEIVVLYGPSGSGKSTFMKMLTERIKLEKSTDIPTTSRYLFYDEKLRFGKLSIFEELFCCSENPDLKKMQSILENFHLWSEIKSNCVDVWQWMKEKRFENSLSNGQKQRLILAKMMYWLDETIDVLVLDECTSGLDDKVDGDSVDAERILAYIVRYANMDKKRIIIIATHQNIDGFKSKLESDFVFRNFQFMKNECGNKITEI